MKILHLDTGREMRGGQWQVLRLLRGLRGLGHSVRLLSAAASPLSRLCANEHIPCGVLRGTSVRAMSGHVDLVHAHDARAHTIAAVFAKRPLVVSRRVIFPLAGGLLSRWKYSRPALFLAVSEAVAAQLRHGRVPAARIRVIYDGVPLLPDWWDARGPVVIPRISDVRKRTDLALAACTLAGAPVLRSSHLQKDLSGAGLLLYLTQSEGLGSAALLAMSAGIPVIASDLGGLREAVADGVTGLLVPNDCEAVAAAVRQLREDFDRARQMSVAARLSVEEKFSETRMVAATVEAYRSVLARH